MYIYRKFIGKMQQKIYKSYIHSGVHPHSLEQILCRLR